VKLISLARYQPFVPIMIESVGNRKSVRRVSRKSTGSLTAVAVYRSFGFVRSNVQPGYMDFQDRGVQDDLGD
jgi:hypothetical protein